MGPIMLALFGVFLVVMVGAFVWRQRNRRPCPSCGLSVNPDEASCPYCGASMRG